LLLFYSFEGFFVFGIELLENTARGLDGEKKVFNDSRFVNAKNRKIWALYFTAELTGKFRFCLDFGGIFYLSTYCNCKAQD
jgi:hypothetical protein